MADFEPDFDAFLNLDAAGEGFAFDYASCMTPETESGEGGSFLSSLPSFDAD